MLPCCTYMCVCVCVCVYNRYTYHVYMGTSILHTYIYYTHIHMILYIVCMYNMYISTLPLKHLGTQAAALLLVNERLIVKVPDPRCVEVCIASEPLQTQIEREGGGGVGQTCGKQKSKGHVSQYARSQRQLTSEHRDKRRRGDWRRQVQTPRAGQTDRHCLCSGLRRTCRKCSRTCSSSRSWTRSSFRARKDSSSPC